MSKFEHLSLDVPQSKNPRVIIIGGGFAGISIAKKLENENVQVVMIDRHNYHTFQPLLYQVATAGLEPDSIAGPLRKIATENKEFYFRMTKVTRIVPEENKVSTVIGDLSYDYLVLACGSVTNFFGNKGAYKYGFPLKKIPQALDLRSQLLQCFEKSVLTKDKDELESLMNFVIVGGGPTGVELAGALGELKLHVLPKDYPDLDFNRMQIYLVEGLPRLLNGMSDFAGEKALKYLHKFDVTVLLNKMVTEYDGKVVKLNDDSFIPSQTVVWAAGVKGNVIQGLKPDTVEKDRYVVDEYNRIVGYENIFAVGDVAMMKSEELPRGHPMLAPVAIQQGELFAKNIVRFISKKPLKPFKYLDKGTLATIGRNKALVDLPGNIKFGGFFAWLIWMFVHIMYIVGFRSKFVVLSNWVWNYFTYDRGIRLIIRPYIREKSTTSKE